MKSQFQYRNQQNHSTQLSSASPTSIERNTLPRVLIVDDDRQSIKILNNILKDDYQIKMASNGKEALLRAQNPPKPDLILLDIVMPIIDGFQVFEKLKADENTCDIPVIFVSGKGSEVNVIQGWELGCQDFIIKPLQSNIVRTRVKKQIYKLLKKNQKQKIKHQQNFDLTTTELDSDPTSHQRLEESIQQETIFFNKWQEDHSANATTDKTVIKPPGTTASQKPGLLDSVDAKFVNISDDVDEYYFDILTHDSKTKTAEYNADAEASDAQTTAVDKGIRLTRPTIRSAQLKTSQIADPVRSVPEKSQDALTTSKFVPVLKTANIVFLLSLLVLVGIEFVHTYSQLKQAEPEKLQQTDVHEATSLPEAAQQNKKTTPTLFAPEGSWIVVLKTAISKNEADSLKRDYENMGLKVVLKISEDKGVAIWYRICVEGFKNYDEAKQYIQSLQRDRGLHGAWVSRFESPAAS